MASTKTGVVREYVRGGRYKEALAIAKGFRLGIAREQALAMEQAYECMVHDGRFYEQVGIDKNKAIADGISVITLLFGGDRVA